MFSHSYHHHATEPRLPPSSAPSPQPHTGPQGCPDRLLDHYRHLESLFDSALATLTVIQDLATTSAPYPDRITDVFQALSRRLLAPTTKTSLLATDTSLPCPADTPRARDKETKTTADMTYARAASAPLPTLASPSPLRSDSDQPDIVVRFDLDPSELARFAADTSPVIIFDAIRESVGSTADGQPLFAGVRWPRKSNLVIQIERGTGTTAYMIDTYAHKIWTIIRPLLRFPPGHPPPTFDTGASWHSVVFHNVPALQRKYYTLSALRQSLQMGGFNHAVKALSVLCDDEELDRRRAHDIPVSLRVSVLTAAAAQQLVETGGNLIGGRYRASHYIHRPRPVAPR